MEDVHRISRRIINTFQRLEIQRLELVYIIDGDWRVYPARLSYERDRTQTREQILTGQAANLISSGDTEDAGA